jgi:hypothetical protein
MVYLSLKRHRGNINEYLKGVILKRLYMPYISNSLTLWKRQKYGDSKKISG